MGLPNTIVHTHNDGAQSEPLTSLDTGTITSMSDSSTDDPLIGALVDGKYSIVELIGKGGMGSVYRAEHNLMERTVAIKFLRITEIDESSEEYLRRFKQEAQTASQLRHPSAITIYDYGIGNFGDRDDSPFLVMEYIEGRTLKSIIKEGRVPAERLIPLMIQVCGALEEAHKLGIIHRDLKPDNIMVSSRGDGSEWAHVLDFGIAKKVTNATGEANMTRTGSVIGTPKYMSPEQILTKNVDQRADVYSLGLIIYEALSGALPFSSNSLMELAVMHVKETPEPLLKRAPDLKLPKAFEKVVMNALEKDPEKRPGSARELSNELREAFPLDFDDSSGSYTFTGLRSPRIESGSNKPLIFGGATLLLAALVGAAFALQSGSSDAPTDSPALSVKQTEEKASEKTPSEAASTKKNESEKASATAKAKEREALMKLLVGESVPKEALEKTEPKAEMAKKEQSAPEPKQEQEKETAKPAPSLIKDPVSIPKTSVVKSSSSTTKSAASKSAEPTAATSTPSKQVIAPAVPSKSASQIEAERRLREAEARAAALERKAREAERQARLAEQRRQAAEAKRAKELQAAKEAPPAKKVQEEAEPEPRRAPRVRRRCGPTWCN